MSKTIRILGHRIPVPLLGVGAAGLVALGAIFVSSSKNKKVARINMTLVPQPLTPLRPSVLSGQFLDENGEPTKVKMGRFLVVLTQPGKPPQVVRGGLIGPNVSSFQAQIDTRGLPVGQYQVIVEDSLGPNADQQTIQSPPHSARQ